MNNQKLAIVNNMRSSHGKKKIKLLSDALKLIDQYVDGCSDFGIVEKIHHYQQEN